LAGAATKLLAEAEEIDSACPEVHLSLSRLHYVWHWNWQRVTEEVHHARELATDSTTKLIAQAWSGYYLALLGDLDRGVRELMHAAAGLPLEPLVSYFLAQAYYLARDCTRAAAVSIEALELHPNCWYLHTIAGKALAILGEYSEALRHLRMAKLLYPEDAGIVEDGVPTALVATIAWVHAMAGKRDRPAKLLTRIQRTSPAGQNASLMVVAMLHAALGDKHLAMNKIEQACAGHDWYVAGLKRECCLDSLRTGPRFRRVLSQIRV
jgi:tetratricopeptide (TPR) repeat protein